MSFRIDIDSIIDGYFDNSSIAEGTAPECAFVLGRVASGKTTLRKQQFASGYVVIDAGDVFIRMCAGRYLDFPGSLEPLLDPVGYAITNQAISQKRNIVTESCGREEGLLNDTISAMKAIGYRVSAHYVECDLETSLERNESRGDENISSYYAEPYHLAWLLQAARAESSAG
jgi:hypothetical protein